MDDVDYTLTHALAGAGYVERAYYGIPYGFALVTRLEQISADGSASQPRWAVAQPSVAEFSISKYLLMLLSAPPGRYRLVVFIVTTVPFQQTDRRVSGEEATGWLSFGLNLLPGKIRAYQAGKCTALIYEFQRRNGRPDLLVPSRLGAQTHLEKSGIWNQLERFSEDRLYIRTGDNTSIENLASVIFRPRGGHGEANRLIVVVNGTVAGSIGFAPQSGGLAVHGPPGQWPVEFEAGNVRHRERSSSHNPVLGYLFVPHSGTVFLEAFSEPPGMQVVRFEPSEGNSLVLIDGTVH